MESVSSIMQAAMQAATNAGKPVPSNQPKRFVIAGSITR